MTVESRARAAAEWRSVHELKKCAHDANRRAERLEREIRDRARQEVWEWSRDLLEDEATVALSIATTGLADPVDVVEAVVLGRDGETLLHERIKPGVRVEGGASEIHGHTAESLDDAPELADVWPRLRETLEGRRVIGYNAEWLADVLADAAERRALEPLDLGAECAMEAYTRVAGAWYVSHEDYASLPLPGRGGSPDHNARAVLDLIGSLARREDPRNPPSPRGSGGSGHDDREEEAFDNIPFMAVFPRPPVQDLL